MGRGAASNSTVSCCFADALALSRRRFLPYVPSAALVAVACAQFALAHATALSPWKLGGFGMFSTEDQPRARTLRIHVLTDDGAFVVPKTRGSEHVLAWPRRARLRAIARQAVCQRWRLVPLNSVGSVAAPSPVWDWVYRSPTVRRRSALAGFAVPDEGGDAARIRAARAVVVTFRLDVGPDESTVVPEEVAAETVTREQAGCAAP